MVAESELKLPQIQKCYLTKLDVVAGDMPNPGSDLPITLSTSVRIEDSSDDANSKMLTIDIGIANENHDFYEMEVQAQAIILYPPDLESDEQAAMNLASIQEVLSAVRIMLDSATTHFKHGAVRIPAINLAESVTPE